MQEFNCQESYKIADFITLSYEQFINCFHPVTLDDVKPLTRAFAMRATMLSDECGSIVYLWAQEFGYTVAKVKDVYFVRDKSGAYFLPICASNDAMLAALSYLVEMARSRGEKLKLFPVTQQKLDFLINENSHCANKFNIEFSTDINRADYIYDAHSLSSLQGKKYHSKRNFLNRFAESYDYSYKDIDKSNVAAAIEFLNVIHSDNSELGDYELKTTYTALENLFELNLCGGMIEVDGKVVAIAIGEKINNVLFVHYEKASRDYDGAYTAINHEFLMHNLSGTDFVNREEDMGIEGLRRAKQSWNPAFLLSKFNVEIC